MAKFLVMNEYNWVSIIVALQLTKTKNKNGIFSLPSVFILLTHFIDIPSKAMHEVAMEKNYKIICKLTFLCF